MLMAGNLVKFKTKDEELVSMGFVPGRYYVVMPTPSGELFVESKDGVPALLIDSNGEMTDFTYDFSLHVCPLLFKGNVNLH